MYKKNLVLKFSCVKSKLIRFIVNYIYFKVMISVNCIKKGDFNGRKT